MRSSDSYGWKRTAPRIRSGETHRPAAPRRGTPLAYPDVRARIERPHCTTRERLGTGARTARLHTQLRSNERRIAGSCRARVVTRARGAHGSAALGASLSRRTAAPALSRAVAHAGRRTDPRGH